MDSHHLKTLAAVGLTAKAGMARSTIHIRFHGTFVALPNSLTIRRRFDYLHAQFMTEDAGIAEERLPSSERMQIGSTNAHSADADQNFVTGLPRRLDASFPERAGLL